MFVTKSIGALIVVINARQTSNVLNNASSYIPTDNGGKRISILIVAYNAVKTLAQLFRRIPSDVGENKVIIPSK